ncbi:hypothetical protein [Lysobacter sp. CA196]|uniref:hypothetical protein n=1 Tax=Lysobacter sp. CA196 TaxID=3455606 RepID=UPI003F8D6311
MDDSGTIEDRPVIACAQPKQKHSQWNAASGLEAWSVLRTNTALARSDRNIDKARFGANRPLPGAAGIECAGGRTGPRHPGSERVLAVFWPSLPTNCVPLFGGRDGRFESMRPTGATTGHEENGMTQDRGAGNSLLADFGTRDIVLEVVADTATQDGAPEVQVTLLVAGVLISGTVIGFERYAQHHPITARIQKAIAGLAARASDEEGALRPGPPLYLHLRDAIYYTPGSQQAFPSDRGVFCRIALKDVSAFNFGSIGWSQPS